MSHVNNNNVNGIKIEFPLDSGVQITMATLMCFDPAGTGSFVGGPTCTRTGTNPASFIIPVVPGKLSYSWMVTFGIKNSNVGKDVQGIKCKACSDAACTTIIDHNLNPQARIQYAPKQLIYNVKIELSNKYTGVKDSQATFKITLANPIVIQGSIFVLMPKSNKNYLGSGSGAGTSSSDTLIYYTSSVPTLQITVKHGNIGSNSYTSVAYHGYGTSDQPFYQKDYMSGFDLIRVRLNNNAEIAAGQVLYFTVGPIHTPPSLMPLTGFIFKTGDQYYNFIDTQDTGIQLACTYPSLFQKTSPYTSQVEISGTDPTKSIVSATNVDYKFTLWLTNPITINGKITITFPSTWTNIPSAPTLECLNSLCNHGSGIITKMPGDPQTYVFNNYLPNYVSFGPLVFLLKGMTNYHSNTQQLLSVTTYQYKGVDYRIDSANDDTFKLQFTPGKITITSIVPSETMISLKNGWYKFEFSTEHDITQDYILFIVVPLPWSVQQKALCRVKMRHSTVLLDQNYGCYGDGSMNRILIKNFIKGTASTVIPKNTNIILEIDSIANPIDFVDSTLAANKFQIRTETSQQGIVDGDTASFAHITANTYVKSYVPVFTVATGLSPIYEDYRAGNYPVRYVFKVIPGGRVAKDAYMVVQFPEDIVPWLPNQMVRLCSMMTNFTGFTEPTVNCKFDSNKNQLKIMDGWKSSNSISDPPLLTWQLNYLKNPRAIRTSGMFHVTIYNKINQELFAMNHTINSTTKETWGPNVTMLYTANPQIFTYTRSNETNGQLINMTFDIKPTNWVEINDLITITLPKPVHFTNQSNCTGDSYWLDGPLLCTFTDEHYKGNFSYYGNLSQEMNVVVVNISVRGEYYRENINRRLLQSQEQSYPELDWNYDNKHHRGRNLLISKIPINQLLVLNLTNIQTAPSLRPSEKNITYNITTKGKWIINRQQSNFRDAWGKQIVIPNNKTGFHPLEYNITDFKMVNKRRATLDQLSAGVSPNWWEKGRLANYTVTFKPINFVNNMKIDIGLSQYVKIPQNWNSTCRGILGVERLVLDCSANYENHTITIDNAFTTIASDLKPEIISFEIENLTNPIHDVVTDSFRIMTRTWDFFQMDFLENGLELNFYCTFPCQTCNATQPDQCFSCYTKSTSKYFYLYNYECIDMCPNGQYENQTQYKNQLPGTFNNQSKSNHLIHTCQNCNWPCSDCQDTADSCYACVDTYKLYDVEHTCYKQVDWWFPYLWFSFAGIVISCMADWYHMATNILYATAFFLSFTEVFAIFHLISLYLDGEVDGDRSLSMTSFFVHFFLNWIFIIVHTKSIMSGASIQYRQLRKDFKHTFWIINGFAYTINYKTELMLISQFAGIPMFSGTFNQDSWQKFNIFTLLYILLVYLPFIGDFYSFFMQNGFRTLASYISMELVIIQTILAIILILEVLNECNCFGMKEADLGNRANLYPSKNKGGKKRREFRSGMGNEESSYGSESYDSEEDSKNDIELKPRPQFVKPALRPITPEVSSSSIEESSSEVEESSSQSSSISSIKPPPREKTPPIATPPPPKEKTPKRKKTPSPKGPSEAEKTLQQLALDMKEEHKQIEMERQRIIEKETELLKQHGNWKDETNSIRQEITSIKQDRDKITEEVDQRIADKLAGIDGNKRKTPAGHWIIELPYPVFEKLDYMRELDGDEEYWLQNLSGIHGDASARSQINEKDGSVVEFIEKEDAVLRDDITNRKSRVGTEKEGMNMSQSALYSNNDGKSSFMGKSNMGRKDRERDGSELQHLEERSADFGDASNLDNYDKSAYDKSFEKPKTPVPRSTTPPPMMDQDGHSDESSEGMVANHDPFKGIDEAIEKQEEMRKSISDPFTPTETEEAKESIPSPTPQQQIQQDIEPSEQEQEDNIPSGRRRLKQVLYSDKSESSVDDMMEDTPSNYNIANGRLEGKSMGLKAILLYAKNQGIQLGDQGTLPQIMEEGVNNSGENQWANMNHPMQGVGTTHVIGDLGDSRIGQQPFNIAENKKAGKRNPGSKQFLEQMDNPGMTPLRKNNFIQK